MNSYLKILGSVLALEGAFFAGGYVDHKIISPIEFREGFREARGKCAQMAGKYTDELRSDVISDIKNFSERAEASPDTAEHRRLNEIMQEIQRVGYNHIDCVGNLPSKISEIMPDGE